MFSRKSTMQFKTKALKDLSMARHLGVESDTDITSPANHKRQARVSPPTIGEDWSLKHIRTSKDKSEAREQTMELDYEHMELHFTMTVTLEDDAVTREVVDLDQPLMSQ